MEVAKVQNWAVEPQAGNEKAFLNQGSLGSEG
jgi:hypothetical protein